MRRTFALIIAVAVSLMAAPAIGANPNAARWVETDVMGAEVVVAPPRMAGDWLHLQYERHGTFTACAGDDCTHAGNVGWTAAGKMKLDEAGEFPVFGTFRAKGYYEFTAGPKTGVTCDLTIQSKLVEDSTVFPPFVFYGNQVAHCSDGSMIHGRILGPTGLGSFPPYGFEQTVTGWMKG
jgi:hypothetical protein